MNPWGVRSTLALFMIAAAVVAVSSPATAQVVHHACQAAQLLQQSDEAALEHMGQSIAVGGDFNGDGIKDIVMGGYDRLALGYSLTDGYGNAATRVFVFLGTGNSPGSGQPLFRHRLTIRGEGVTGTPPIPGHMDLFGYSVAFIRGVDVDPEHPCDSIVVGAPAFNGAGGTESGRVWIFPGSPSLDPSDTSFDPATDEIDAANANAWPDVVILDGLVDHGWFGESVATAQDSSGAFLNRLLVGAPGKGPVDTEEYTAGMAYDFEAATVEAAVAIEASTPGTTIEVSPSSGTPGITGSGGTGYVATADLLVHGDSLGDQFGHAVAFVGNVYGSSAQEFLVGAPQYSSEIEDSATTGPGYARLFTLGSATPLISISGTQSPGAHSTGEAFGFSVAGGVNLDGDLSGTPDLIIGAPLFDVSTGGVSSRMAHAGRVRVFAGGDAAIGTQTPIFGAPAPNSTLLLGGSGSDQFGYAVAGVKDLDGDSFDDVLVGAWEQAKTDTKCASGRLGLAGAAGLYSLGAAHPEIPLVTFYGEAFKDHLGRAVAVGQLFGTTSKAEVVLSGLAFSDSVAESGRGYVWDGDSMFTADPP